MAYTRNGFLVGFLCFCAGYVAYDLAGGIKLSLVGSAAAISAPVGPNAGPKDATPAHAFDGFDVDRLACDEKFRKAVELVVEFTVVSKSRIKNTQGQYLDKYCERRGL